MIPIPWIASLQAETEILYPYPSKTFDRHFSCNVLGFVGWAWWMGWDGVGDVLKGFGGVGGVWGRGW